MAIIAWHVLALTAAAAAAAGATATLDSRGNAGEAAGEEKISIAARKLPTAAVGDSGGWNSHSSSSNSSSSSRKRSAPSGSTSKKRAMAFYCVGKKDRFFPCDSNTQCVNKRAVCDGLPDCHDGSDERRCACARHSQCPRGQRCRKDLERATSECTPCAEGRRLVDGRCEDIDECALFGAEELCGDADDDLDDHPATVDDPQHWQGDGSASGRQCLNVDGGFVCAACPRGYQPAVVDWRYYVLANQTLGENGGTAGVVSGSNAAADDANSAALAAERAFLRRLFLCVDVNECADANPCETAGKIGGADGDFSEGRHVDFGMDSGGVGAYHVADRGRPRLGLQSKSEICVNQEGSFACHCPPNHSLGPDDAAGGNLASRAEETTVTHQSEAVCRALGGSGQPTVVIGERHSVAVYDLRSAQMLANFSIEEPVADVAAYGETIYVATTTSKVWEYRLVTGLRELLVDLDVARRNGYGAIRRITVDWLHHRLYILTDDDDDDDEDGSVALIDLFGRGGKLHIGEDRPTSSLALDPLARLVFFAGAGCVWSAHLDARPASNEPIFEAPGHGGHVDRDTIAADVNLRRLYYVHDAVLYSFDYNGRQPAVLSANAPYAALELFEDRLFAVYQPKLNMSGLASLSRVGYTSGRGSSGSVSGHPSGYPAADVVAFYQTRPLAVAIAHEGRQPKSRDAVAAAAASNAATVGVSVDGTQAAFAEDLADQPCETQRCAGDPRWCFALPRGHSASGRRCLCEHAINHVTRYTDTNSQGSLTTAATESAASTDEWPPRSSSNSRAGPMSDRDCVPLYLEALRPRQEPATLPPQPTRNEGAPAERENVGNQVVDHHHRHYLDDSKRLSSETVLQQTASNGGHGDSTSRSHNTMRTGTEKDRTSENVINESAYAASVGLNSLRPSTTASIGSSASAPPGVALLGRSWSHRVAPITHYPAGCRLITEKRATCDSPESDGSWIRMSGHPTTTGLANAAVLSIPALFTATIGKRISAF